MVYFVCMKWKQKHNHFHQYYTHRGSLWSRTGMNGMHLSSHWGYHVNCRFIQKQLDYIPRAHAYTSSTIHIHSWTIHSMSSLCVCAAFEVGNIGHNENCSAIFRSTKVGYNKRHDYSLFHIPPLPPPLATNRIDEPKVNETGVCGLFDAIFQTIVPHAPNCMQQLIPAPGTFIGTKAPAEIYINHFDGWDLSQLNNLAFASSFSISSMKMGEENRASFSFLRNIIAIWIQRVFLFLWIVFSTSFKSG